MANNHNFKVKNGLEVGKAATITGKLTINGDSAPDFGDITLNGSNPAVYFADNNGSTAWHFGQNGTDLYILEDPDRNGAYNNIRSYWRGNLFKQEGNITASGTITASSFSGDLNYNDITNPPVIDNSVDYINSASFNTSNGVLTLSGVGRASATVDLDNRYELAHSHPYLSNATDSEQTAHFGTVFWNQGASKVNSDPRINEGNYDADLTNIHWWATTASGANYGRVGHALYNGSAYQYLHTKASQNALYHNNNVIWTAGNFNPNNYLLASNYVDNYADSVSFNTSNGILTIGRTGSLPNLTVDLDNRYLTSYSETDTLQSVTTRGNTTANNIRFTQDEGGIEWERNSDRASIKFYNDLDSDTNSRLEFNIADNTNEDFRFTYTTGTTTTELLRMRPDGGVNGLTFRGHNVYHAGNFDLNNFTIDADTLDGYDYTDFAGVVARYHVTTNPGSGRLKITLPFATNSSRMLKFTVSLYSGYHQETYECSGYLYSSPNNWYEPRAIYSGSSTPDIKFGRDDDGYAYISIRATAYAGAIVHNVTMGHTGSDLDAYRPWTIEDSTVAPNTVTPWVAKNLTTKNFDEQLYVRKDSAQALSSQSNAFYSEGNILKLKRGNGDIDSVDISPYLDDTNLARLVSGTVNSSGIATFNRDDSSSFTVDMSVLLDDTNLARIVSASWNTGNGVLTLTRNDSSTIDVDLDNRYLQSYTETDTLQSVTARGNTTNRSMTITSGSPLEWARSGGNAHQRADARLDGSDQARLHWYGKSDSSATRNFKHAWYDGASYINVTASSGGRIDFTGAASSMYIGTDRVFDDGYHPNADKWTTARTNTVTLTGDVTGTGSASVDGSGNWTVSVPTVVANNSHEHDHIQGSSYSDTDLNTIANAANPGELHYDSFSSSAPNKPPTADNANGVITVGQHSGNYNAQLAFSSNGNMYWRDNPTSSFGSWRKIYDSSHFDISDYDNRSVSDGRYVNVTGDTMTGALTIGTTNDAQLYLTSPDTWTGIGFNDSGNNNEFIWHYGTTGTFAIGGGGSTASGKKLHVHGAMTIGSSYAQTSVGTNGLLVQGDITTAGLLTATQKSFTIDHPTKAGHKLRYGSLEGPENGVYVRGRLKDSNVIELPDVWVGLVHEDSITVSLTAIGKSQEIWVEDIVDNKVIVGGDNINCFYHVFAERKDVDKLVTEFKEVE